MTTPIALLDFAAKRPIGQMRVVPIFADAPLPVACCFITSARAFVDPSPGMLYFPDDGLHIDCVGTDGTPWWSRELARSTLPGTWFAPFHAADIDGDGRDELYCVRQEDRVHPLNPDSYALVRIDPFTGTETGAVPWPKTIADEPLYMQHRHFLTSGRVGGYRILVTAQGTYRRLALQARGADLQPRWRWQADREPDDPHRGAAGSHMLPVVDLDGDGDDEVLLGERLIDLVSGRERWCAARDSYQGHSDVIQPTWDRDQERWRVFTCRESDPTARPRVVCYDADGEPLWGEVAAGHMDMGWTAHVAGADDEDRQIAYALRVGNKEHGPDGTVRTEREEFLFDLRTGATIERPFPLFTTIPVDFDGDGHHEFVSGVSSPTGALWRADGRSLGSIDCAEVAGVGKLCDHPGEQIVARHADDHIRIWADADAVDTEPALARYAHPYYRNCLCSYGHGYHPAISGGL